jgi:hypothetical protein
MNAGILASIKAREAAASRAARASLRVDACPTQGYRRDGPCTAGEVAGLSR